MKPVVAFSIFTLLFLYGIPSTSVQAQATPPPTSQTPGKTATVHGRVVNKSFPDKGIAKLEVMLHIFDATDQSDVGMLHAESSAGGSYQVGDVPFREGLGYVAMASYDGVAYSSEPQYAQEGQSTINLDVPIYESSTDLSAVEVDQAHVLINFAQDGMEIKEIYLLSNRGDRTVKDGVALPDGKKAALPFTLPKEAQFILFPSQDPDRFVKFPGGFADTAPLTPGENTGQILVSYLLPYSESLSYSYQATFPTKTVSLILPTNSGVKLTGNGLEGPITQMAPNGQPIEEYRAGNLSQDKGLKVVFSGKPKLSSAAISGPPSNPASSAGPLNPPILLAGGVLGLALLGVGIVWWRRSQPVDRVAETFASEFDQLISQIALLDQQQRDGLIGDATYLPQRAILMERARGLMETDEHPPLN